MTISHFAEETWDDGGAGLLDIDGAAQEIDVTEKQLHTMVDRLRIAAGVE
jgi:hypothetical protein